MRSLIQLYSLVLEKIIPTECLGICNIIDKFYTEKTISGAEYFALKQHFKEIPRPASARSKEFRHYWPLNNVKDRANFVRSIIQELKKEEAGSIKEIQMYESDRGILTLYKVLLQYFNKRIDIEISRRIIILYYMDKISIREYDRLYNHFTKVPKPADYYWQDTESNSSRIKFIKDIIINLEKMHTKLKNLELISLYEKLLDNFDNLSGTGICIKITILFNRGLITHYEQALLYRHFISLPRPKGAFSEDLSTFYWSFTDIRSRKKFIRQIIRELKYGKPTRITRIVWYITDLLY